MDQLITDVVALVSGAGGSMLYPDLLAQVEPERRAILPMALKNARKANLLTQDVKLVDGVIVHTYYKV